MDTVAHLQVLNDGQGLDYFIPEKDLVQDSDIPTAHLAGYIAVVVGGAHYTKQLPANQLKMLCEKIKHPIMLLGGKDDAVLAAQIAAKDPFKIYNACGKFNLNESADLVRRSKFVITNDTGLMHIAAAFKKPIISIWGNTVPAFGMTPYYGTYIVMNAMIENKNLRCRPCSKIGYNSCPKDHFKCMNNLNMDDIVSTATNFLKRS
jgi:heptosyltransferase-2